MERQIEPGLRDERLLDRTERRRLATRARLLAAARTVFARQGLADATIAQIAEEADLGFGTFYLYFPTKEDAYRAVVMEGFAELSERLAETRRHAADAGLPWWETVRRSVAAYYAFAAANRELFIAMCAGGDTGAGLGREIQEQFVARIAEMLSATYAASKTDPCPRMYSYSPALAARAMVAALNQVVLWWIREAAGAMPLETSSSPGAEPSSSSRLSLESLADAMGRFVASGLGGRLPTDNDNSRSK